MAFINFSLSSFSGESSSAQESTSTVYVERGGIKGNRLATGSVEQIPLNAPNHHHDQLPQTSEPNKFLSMRKNIAGTHKDIGFLKRCYKQGLVPVSHKIKTSKNIPQNLIKKMEQEFLKTSIKKLYARLEVLTLKAYNLHLKLAKNNPIHFELFLTKVKIAENCESERKRKLLNFKFQALKTKQTKKPCNPSVQVLDNFVVNRSSATFTAEELKFLNNGLSYASHSKDFLENNLIDIESGIRSSNLSEQQCEAARLTVSNTMSSQNLRNPSHGENTILRSLRDKSVFYVKADKGNTLVILDKHDYDKSIQEKIDSGPYRKLRINPLKDMVKRVDSSIKQNAPILGNFVKTLKISNPVLPRMKGLPKIHKPGNEFREIVSSTDAPTQKLAKWLVNEFKNMPKPLATKAVANSNEFVQKLLSSNNISEDEVMVSFDVTALFPNIPVKDSINLLEDWLLQQHSDAGWKTKVKSYINLTRLCMDESFFTFRGQFYRQTKGAPMGNPLSPFLSEIFMSNFEQNLETKGHLPSRWWRYVDDIFSIVKKSELPSILENLNNAHGNISFTFEIEKENKLPFLDILVLREPTSFSIEIFRKPTNTKRVIPNTSNHPIQHKMAAFHHMIHRLETLPLGQIGRKKELEYIFETAKLNGYTEKSIESIIAKKKKTLLRNSLTKLRPDTKEFQRVATNFNNFSQNLKPKLKKFKIDLVFSSRENQLSSILGSTKDPIDKREKSGVYKIDCSQCNKSYIGQTKRSLTTRFKEHAAEISKAVKETEKGLVHNFKSAVAEHIFHSKHKLSIDNLSLLNHISSQRKLEVAESLEIFKHQSQALLNKDVGNGFTNLFLAGYQKGYVKSKLK